MSAADRPAGHDPFESLRDLPPLAAPELPAELERELVGLKPTPTRRPMRQVAIAAVASLVYGALMLLVVTVRRDLEGLPRMWLGLYLGAWFVGFALPLYLSIVPRAGGMMPRWRVGGVLAALSAVGFVAAGFAFPRSTPESLERGLSRAHPCLSIGLATALGPVVVAALMLRGAAPVGSRWTAAALGAAGGALGGLVLHLHCPIADGVHVGVVHGGVVACAALLAAAVVPRALKP